MTDFFPSVHLLETMFGEELILSIESQRAVVKVRGTISPGLE